MILIKACLVELKRDWDVIGDMMMDEDRWIICRNINIVQMF